MKYIRPIVIVLSIISLIVVAYYVKSDVLHIDLIENRHLFYFAEYPAACCGEVHCSLRNRLRPLKRGRKNYPFKVNTQVGKKILGVTFTNDAWVPEAGEDRNLQVGEVGVVGRG